MTNDSTNNQTKAKKTFTFVRQLVLRVKQDEILALGSQFAYHLLFALFPFLLFLAALVSFVSLNWAESFGEISSIVPEDALKVIQSTLAEVSGQNRTDILSISMLISIYLASNGFAAVTRGLNKAYDVPETRGFVKVRLLSLLFVPLIALGILFEAVAVVFGKTLLCNISHALCWSPTGETLMNILRFVLPFLMTVVIFMLIYAATPNRHLTLRQALPGAIFTSTAWATASVAFSFYVNRFANYSRLYGSLGGVLILLFWLYITSVVLLVGSEINAALYRMKKEGCGLH